MSTKNTVKRKNNKEALQVHYFKNKANQFWCGRNYHSNSIRQAKFYKDTDAAIAADLKYNLTKEGYTCYDCELKIQNHRKSIFYNFMYRMKRGE